MGFGKQELHRMLIRKGDNRKFSNVSNIVSAGH